MAKKITIDVLCLKHLVIKFSSDNKKYFPDEYII